MRSGFGGRGTGAAVSGKGKGTGGRGGKGGRPTVSFADGPHPTDAGNLDDDADIPDDDFTFDAASAESTDTCLEAHSAVSPSSDTAAPDHPVELVLLIDGGSNVNLCKSRDVAAMGTPTSANTLHIGSCSADGTLVTKGTFAVDILPAGGIGLLPAPSRLEMHDTPNARRDIISEHALIDTCNVQILKSPTGACIEWRDTGYKQHLTIKNGLYYGTFKVSPATCASLVSNRIAAAVTPVPAHKEWSRRCSPQLHSPRLCARIG